jgi:hypothetical protein
MTFYPIIAEFPYALLDQKSATGDYDENEGNGQQYQSLEASRR